MLYSVLITYLHLGGDVELMRELVARNINLTVISGKCLKQYV